jgi:S-DNA-T family DNA segregation ATPase FtsK/SpoIIIE
MAYAIEGLLAAHGIAARVTGGTVASRWVRFHVLPSVGGKISDIRWLSDELAAALEVGRCRVSRRGVAVAIEVDREKAEPVELLQLFQCLAQGKVGIPALTAILGLAEDGAPLLIRLPARTVGHIAVGGRTQAGKTQLLRTMALSLAMANGAPARGNGGAHGTSLVLMDPKGTSFGPFAGLPHLARPVISEASEALEALNSLVYLMDRRDQVGSVAAPSRYIVVVIDDLIELLSVGGEDVRRALVRLTQGGARAGIHVVAAVDDLGVTLRGLLAEARFPVRLVGQVASIDEARLTTGWSGSGAERLLGQGDFLAIAEGRLTRYQVARVSLREIKAAVEDLARSRTLSVPPGADAGASVSCVGRAFHLARNDVSC